MKKYPRAQAMLQGLGVYLVFLFLPVGLVLGAGLLFPRLGDAAMDFLTLFSSLPAALLLILLWRIGGQGIKESAGCRFSGVPLRSCGAAFAWGILGNWVVAAFLSLLPESLLASYAEQAGNTVQESPWLTFLSVVLAAPVFEEVIFRGMIFRLFRQAVPPYWAAALSGVLFGAAHGHLLWAAYAFVLGFFLALLAERAGTITVSVAAHMGFNLTPFLTMFLPEDAPFLESAWFQMALGLLAAVGATVIWRKYFFKRGLLIQKG